MFPGRRQISIYFLAVAALMQESSGYAANQCSSNIKLVLKGRKIPIEDAPYMAALLVKCPFDEDPKHHFFCGASIIHERFLLSAAHCNIHAILPWPVTVTASLGSERYRNTSTNTVMEVEKFLCHENFDGSTLKNDICLVKLKKPVTFGAKIARIKLAMKDIKTKAMVTVTGWGQTSSYGEHSLDLLRATVPVLSTKCCNETDGLIEDTMICAGVKGSGAACYGDSGGPLVYNHVQVGVVSRGNMYSRGCGEGMDVYTRVNKFLGWIDTTIANNL